MRIAVVIDVSGSVEPFLDLYSLDAKLSPIILRVTGGCDPEALKELEEKYDRIYFFTDGFFLKPDWGIILSPKIHVIKINGSI